MSGSGETTRCAAHTPSGTTLTIDDEHVFTYCHIVSAVIVSCCTDVRWGGVNVQLRPPNVWAPSVDLREGHPHRSVDAAVVSAEGVTRRNPLLAALSLSQAKLWDALVVKQMVIGDRARGWAICGGVTPWLQGAGTPSLTNVSQLLSQCLWMMYQYSPS